MRIPNAVWSALGPVVVQGEAGMHKAEKDPAFGDWQAISRTIRIDTDACAATQIATLFHEMCHVALWDAGVVVTDEQEESICDAIGTYFGAAMLNGYVKLIAPK
jgi:hypothetical protein